MMVARIMILAGDMGKDISKNVAKAIFNAIKNDSSDYLDMSDVEVEHYIDCMTKYDKIEDKVMERKACSGIQATQCMSCKDFDCVSRSATYYGSVTPEEQIRLTAMNEKRKSITFTH